MEVWEARRKIRKERWEKGGNLFTNLEPNETLADEMAKAAGAFASVPNSTTTNNPAGFGGAIGTGGPRDKMSNVDQATKHARRLYVGNIPQGMREEDLRQGEFLNCLTQ